MGIWELITSVLERIADFGAGTLSQGIGFDLKVPEELL